jgi:3-oxoacyl-(acyl-carrier-protein) synthase
VEHAAVYAPKSALGHSIGAVGALESILTVLALRDGVIPPTLNYETPDPEIDLDVVAGEPRYGTIGTPSTTHSDSGTQRRSPSGVTEVSGGRTGKSTWRG